MDQSELVAEGVARIWSDPSVRRELDVDRLEPALLRALRALECAPEAGRRAAEAEVLGLFATVPTAAATLRDRIELLRAAQARESTGSGVDVAETARHYRHSLVELVYVTDRRPTGDPVALRQFGGDRGEVSFGTAGVSLRDDPRMGELPDARPWRLGFSRDPRARLSVDGSPSAGLSGLASTMADLLRRAPEPEILIFIHGYNVSFADAVCRTAQIAYDLDFKGVPLLYSWASEGAALRYPVDGENAELSREHFTDLLRVLSTEVGGARVHVIAHSMGNRILTGALADPAVADGPGRLGQVVFAAPDVDADVFAQRAKRFAGRAERCTLYVSDRDQPLNLSRRLARYPRAGQAGDGVLVVDGVDTVDASALDTGLVSHSYVLEHRSVLSDVYSLLRHGHPPNERFGLRPFVSPTGTYWAFRREV